MPDFPYAVRFATVHQKTVQPSFVPRSCAFWDCNEKLGRSILLCFRPISVLDWISCVRPSITSWTPEWQSVAFFPFVLTTLHWSLLYKHFLVQTTSRNLKTWKAPSILISDKYKRQSVNHNNSRTWDFVIFTPRKQLGVYVIAQGLCSWCAATACNLDFPALNHY